MILAFCSFNYDWSLTRMAAIFDLANMAAPAVVCLNAHQKLKRFGMDNISAKFGTFAKFTVDPANTALS